jgi:hypothetical protein
MMALRSIALVLVFVLGCGGSQPSPNTPGNAGSDGGNAVSGTPAFHDTRTAIERRRDSACEKLGPRNTSCAVADARKSLANGVDATGHHYTQAMFDADTAPEVQAKNTQVFIDKCEKQHLNSYQVRVYEVCMHEETECDPLLACLQHVHDAAAGGAP